MSLPGTGIPATSAAALRDVWLHSGDLGTRDSDGRIHFVDRLQSALINRLRGAGYRFVPPGRRDHTTPTAALDLHGSP
ncbi:hypothetical protein FRACA_2890010 [Frankia canadensis]|uniref:Uncharacterized protein n=1 Tax=Frankia canadensis TaxID=1836972 RepID=A0A2I2KT95_9ACTN|nr:AMP-binding protein [Frankia canadensis]SNQ48887.1 hypothetical protein FRACA_2890010 [Frankia canadensis]SOU56177.1 hypothetical protein FRACA_2890010 [Frankia canadensis]